MEKFDLNKIKDKTDIIKIKEWEYKADTDFFFNRTGRLMIINIATSNYDIDCYSGYILAFAQKKDVWDEYENYFSYFDMSHIKEISVTKNNLIINANCPSRTRIVNKIENDDILEVYKVLLEYIEKAQQARNDYSENHEKIIEDNGGKGNFYTLGVEISPHRIVSYDCWMCNEKFYMLERGMRVMDKESLKQIKLSEILYYRFYSQVDMISEVRGGGGSIKGGGTNLNGAVLGGVIAGSTGAIIGSREKISGTINPITTSVQKYDNSYVILKTQKETIKFITKSTVQTLEKMMPEKDYDRINDHEKISEKNNLDDSIEEIRKYKQLLDEGIITQEEFDIKKKQLLNI